MMILIRMYIKNFMIKYYLYILLSFYFFTDVHASEIINEKQKSLNDLETEIIQLESKLKQQIETEQGADQKIKDLKERIAFEKQTFNKKQNQFQITSNLLGDANSLIDSLQLKTNEMEGQKNNTESMILDLKKRRKEINKNILNNNKSLNDIQNQIQSNVDSMIYIKNKIKNLLSKSVFENAPSSFEFIIESETWNEFIINSILYDILIENRENSLEYLLVKKNKINESYNENLEMQGLLIKNKNKLNDDLKKSKILLSKLNSSIDILKIELAKSKNNYDEINDKYILLLGVLDKTENKLKLLKSEKQEITKIQKDAEDEKKRIEYTLQLKKESRDKVEKQLKKLLLKSSDYVGTDINKYKGKLKWPLKGTIISNFGINTSETGTKFNYTFIELVSNQELYISSEINPNNPNKNIVKKFQRKTMGMKKGDTGYGVFGPKTTKKWKEYSRLIKEQKKESIIATHDGIIEEIKFIDPITGVLIIIKHNNQSFSTYSGQMDLIVSKNETVLSGQKIGLINKEDILAFSLLVNGKLVDPMDWLVKK